MSDFRFAFLHIILFSAIIIGASKVSHEKFLDLKLDTESSLKMTAIFNSFSLNVRKTMEMETPEFL